MGWGGVRLGRARGKGGKEARGQGGKGARGQGCEGARGQGGNKGARGQGGEEARGQGGKEGKSQSSQDGKRDPIKLIYFIERQSQKRNACSALSHHNQRGSGRSGFWKISISLSPMSLKTGKRTRPHTCGLKTISNTLVPFTKRISVGAPLQSIISPSTSIALLGKFTSQPCAPTTTDRCRHKSRKTDKKRWIRHNQPPPSVCDG